MNASSQLAGLFPRDEVLACAVALLEGESDRYSVFLTHGAFPDGGFHDNDKHLEGTDLERANKGTEIRAVCGHRSPHDHDQTTIGVGPWLYTIYQHYDPNGGDGSLRLHGRRAGPGDRVRDGLATRRLGEWPHYSVEITDLVGSPTIF